MKVCGVSSAMTIALRKPSMAVSFVKLVPTSGSLRFITRDNGGLTCNRDGGILNQFMF